MCLCTYPRINLFKIRTDKMASNSVHSNENGHYEYAHCERGNVHVFIAFHQNISIIHIYRMTRWLNEQRKIMLHWIEIRFETMRLWYFLRLYGNKFFHNDHSLSFGIHNWRIYGMDDILPRNDLKSLEWLSVEIVGRVCWTAHSLCMLCSLSQHLSYRIRFACGAYDQKMKF